MLKNSLGFVATPVGVFVAYYPIFQLWNTSKIKATNLSLNYFQTKSLTFIFDEKFLHS